MNVCPQCGFFHPPIPEGSVCPVAENRNNKTSDYSRYLSTIVTYISNNKDKLNDETFRKIENFLKQIFGVN